ncbi:unnamed protein product [Cuscuta campestris]|uniref:DUF3741 domain-containing protein n=1 Tax=Cuscuta campestris TaxID=132261 RepID=A0A484N7K0_9ASTE|nr:unnamed protein product [Cuscuta campestris]
MPRNKPRPAVYKSFLSCDDPKGVVECKRIRKSKPGLPDVDETLGKRIEFEASREEMITKQSADKLNCSCSVHLIEVSRGAQKLSHVLESWSKGIGSDRKSKDVAKDLLKGALDLRESLERLEKLQEASGFMTKLSKTKEGNGKGKLKGAGGIERTRSERITGDRMYKLDYGKPRHSIDGASWDCYEELREAILDSFARQNWSLPPDHAMEKGSFGNREMELSPDLPSTSSSQSSFEKACFDRKRTVSSPDLPSTSSSQSSFEKGYFDRKRIISSSHLPSTSSSQSSVFRSQEFSPPNSSYPMAPHLKPKATGLVAKLMGLEEISSETLKSTSQKLLEKHSLPNQQRPIFEVDFPKTKKLPFGVDKVDPKQRTTQESKGHMQFRSKSFDESRHGVSNRQSVASDLENKFGNGCESIMIMNPLHAPDLPKERSYSMTCPFEDNALDSKEMQTKWKRKELREGDKQYREAVPSPNDNGITGLGKPSPKKSASPRKPMLEKKEVIEKMVGKIQRVSPKMRKEGMQNMKLMEACKPLELEKMAYLKLKKQECVLNISEQEAAFCNSRSRMCMNKTDKPAANLGDKKEHIDLKPKKERNKPEIFHFEEVSDVSQTLVIDDQCTDDTLSCISTALTIGSEFDEHDQFFINPKSNPKANTTKNLLLNSTHFLNHAKDLFHTCAWKPAILKPDYSHDEMPETQLLLDCASELLENKNLQITLSLDRLPIIRPQLYISLDKLAAEICDGIDTLMSYRDLSDNTLCMDTSSMLIERDMQCKGAARAAFELGWGKGFTCNEVEHVVADMEKLIFGGILGDALDDFCRVKKSKLLRYDLGAA